MERRDERIEYAMSFNGKGMENENLEEASDLESKKYGSDFFNIDLGSNNALLQVLNGKSNRKQSTARRTTSAA